MDHKFKVGQILKYTPLSLFETMIGGYDARYCRVLECTPGEYKLSDCASYLSLDFVHRTHTDVADEEAVILILEGKVDV